MTRQLSHTRLLATPAAEPSSRINGQPSALSVGHSPAKLAPTQGGRYVTALRPSPLSIDIWRSAGGRIAGDRDAGVSDAGVSDAGAPPAAGVPPVPAPASGPGSPPGPVALPPLAVTLPAHIRNSSSPAGMADRIPPRVDTPVAVGITGFTRGVTLTVDGGSAANGTATINGAASANLATSATVQLRGVDQTTPGNAGNLQLVARQAGAVVARSGSFSVSAIPQNWSISFHSLRTGPNRGIVVQDRWESDSGVVADLNETEISEEVQSGTGTGIFAGIALSTSGFLPGNVFTRDTHGTTTAALTGPGSITLEQTSKFNDKRSGSTDIPMRNSGYRIVHSTFRAPIVGALLFGTHKVGAATTANGVTSAAGAGSVTRIQAV